MCLRIQSNFFLFSGSTIASIGDSHEREYRRPNDRAGRELQEHYGLFRLHIRLKNKQDVRSLQRIEIQILESKTKG